MKKNINVLFLITILIAVGIGVYFVFKPFLIAIFAGFALLSYLKIGMVKLISCFGTIHPPLL